MAEQDLVLEHRHKGAVIQLTLNRPQVRNALSISLYRTLARTLTRLSNDDSVRIIVLCGRGATFTSGMDVVEAASNTQATREIVKAAYEFMKALMDCRALVMAAVHGRVTGIGVTLLAHCDFVYGCEDCSFETPFASVGIVAEFSSSFLFPLYLGRSLSARLLLRGELISVKEMEQVGFIKVLQGEKNIGRRVCEMAMEWSEKCCDEEWRSVERGKQIVREAWRNKVEECGQRESDKIGELIEQGVPQRLMGDKVEMMRRRKARL